MLRRVVISAPCSLQRKNFERKNDFSEMSRLLGLLLATTRQSGRMIREIVEKRENLQIVEKSRQDDVQTIIDRKVQEIGFC